MPAADQHEAVAALPQRVPQPRCVGDQLWRCQLDQTRWGAQQLGQPRLQRPQVYPVRCRLEPRQCQAFRPGAERVAVGPSRSIMSSLRS